MNCTDFRTELDTVTATEQASGAAEVHLRECSDCRRWFSQVQAFDDQVRQALADVPVPAGLQERLLAEVATVRPAASQSKVKRFFRWRLAMALTLLLAVGGWWLMQRPAQPGTLDFVDLQERLQQQFASGVDSQSLTAMSGLTCSSVEEDLARLRIANPSGLELDSVPGTDAALYQFQFKRWSGVVVAIPSARLSNPPANPVPAFRSGVRSLTWQSRSGEWSYVCFLHSGPREGFVEALFGGLA